MFYILFWYQHVLYGREAPYNCLLLKLFQIMLGSSFFAFRSLAKNAKMFSFFRETFVGWKPYLNPREKHRIKIFLPDSKMKKKDLHRRRTAIPWYPINYFYFIFNVISTLKRNNFFKIIFIFVFINSIFCSYHLHTGKPLIMNTSEKFIKCRLDNFLMSFILYYVNFSICENK